MMNDCSLRQTTFREDGSVLHEFECNSFQVFLLLPKNDRQSNLINYGFTGPTLTVFPDNKLRKDELDVYAAEKGLLPIAEKNGVGIIFVNPTGTDWSREPVGAYEAVASNLAIAQSNFRDGLAVVHDDTLPDEVAYKILGSCVRMYVYGFGSGADYVSAHYLKHMTGSAVLGDLGQAELTMVCCTLVQGSRLPAPEKNDIHVVSVGNSEAYNRILREYCEEVVTEDTVDLARDFRNVIGNYRRWVGKIMPAYNYEAEGIIDMPESVMLPISEDNEAFHKQFFFMKNREHKVGYVTFYDKNLDVKNGKVPLVLVFHGGGDSAYATASLAEWPEIGQAEHFLTVAVEMHLTVSAKEVSALIDHLMEEYSIDPERIYATGFSMGGIKSWDLLEQCPERFAALMPMDAIQYVGGNCFGGKTEVVNEDILVPLFYVGGVDSFGVELPCHHERAIERIAYVAKVNRFKENYSVSLDQKDHWEDPFYGMKGAQTDVLHDEMFPESEYRVNYYESEDGNCYTALMSVTHQGHEIRPFTNRFAWNFVKKFRRTKDGIRIDNTPTVK